MVYKNQFCRHLWMDLYKTFNTWWVSVGNRDFYKEIFWVLDPKSLGPQNYLFSTSSELGGNFEGQYLRWGTWYRQSGNCVGNYKGSPTSSQNFINFGPLTAKNRTIVFTHPPKSSSACYFVNVLQTRLWNFGSSRSVTKDPKVSTWRMMLALSVTRRP